MSSDRPMISTGHRAYAVPTFMQTPQNHQEQSSTSSNTASNAPPQQTTSQAAAVPQAPEGSSQPLLSQMNARNRLPSPANMYSVVIDPLKPKENVYRSYPAEVASAHIIASNSGGPAVTCPPPPSSVTSNVVQRDHGSAIPRFMRMTMCEMPANSRMVKDIGLPVGCLMTPLADVSDEKESVLLLDHGEEGPLRCDRCHAYISPFAEFSADHSEYNCAICRHKNTVPAWFRVSLPEEQKKPALTRGSVEYSVGSNRIYRSGSFGTGSPAICFVLDASPDAIRSGRVTLIANCIKQAIQSGVIGETRVGFISYNCSCVHFWDFTGECRGLPRMLSVSDVNEMFCPTGKLFVKVAPSKEGESDSRMDAVVRFLEKFGELAQSEFDEKLPNLPVFGSAIQGAALAFRACNLSGRVVAFYCGVPTGGAGPLCPREKPILKNPNVDDGKAEKRLLMSAGRFYRNLALKCAECHVGVDLFAVSELEADLATVSELSKYTGGQVYSFPQFNLQRDAWTFEAALMRNVSRTWGVECALRVRVSNGLSVNDYYGHFAPGEFGSVNVEIPILDCEKTIAVMLQHDDDLKEGHDAVVQSALLYTTSTGERRVRVHTVSVPVTKNYSLVYKGLDCDALVGCIARLGVRAIANLTLVSDVCAMFSKMLAETLATYRSNCVISHALGQLVIPETIQVLPLYILALQKLPAFRPGHCNPDERTALLRSFESENVAQLLLTLYPKVYSLSDLRTQLEGGKEGEITIPAVRLSTMFLNPNDVYLVDDGSQLYLYLAGTPHVELLEAIFGPLTEQAMLSIKQIGNVRPVDLPGLEHLFAQRLTATHNEGDDTEPVTPFVQTIIKLVQSLSRPRLHNFVSIHVCSMTISTIDSALQWKLTIEDRKDGVGYSQFLRDIHDMVNKILQF